MFFRVKADTAKNCGVTDCETVAVCTQELHNSEIRNDTREKHAGNVDHEGNCHELLVRGQRRKRILFQLFYIEVLQLAYVRAKNKLTEKHDDDD